ncbi:unnamed protein product [Sphagnum balticum]
MSHAGRMELSSRSTTNPSSKSQRDCGDTRGGEPIAGRANRSEFLRRIFGTADIDTSEGKKLPARSMLRPSNLLGDNVKLFLSQMGLPNLL